MSSTLTIRNLQEPVKQKLRMRAAIHGRSMEAEAREILTKAVTTPASGEVLASEPARERMKSACESVRGIWKGRMTTDELMALTRGE